MGGNEYARRHFRRTRSARSLRDEWLAYSFAFFAGDLDGIDSAIDALSFADRNAVPMGADYRGTDAPTFWVQAVQDPDSATLDRVQLVKGWIEDGQKRQSVRDVICTADRSPDENGRCPPTTADVDIASCTRADQTGAAELTTTFVDPDFDADQNAFYYLRVLENPSCRWTTWLAMSAGVDIPEDVPATVQHRAWSSPIWIRP